MRVTPVLALAALSLLSVGCSRLDMQDQPKFKAQGTNDFFVDARDGRPELDGTIARGQLNEDTAYYEGKDAAGNDLEASLPLSRWIKPSSSASHQPLRHLLFSLPRTPR